MQGLTFRPSGLNCIMPLSTLSSRESPALPTLSLRNSTLATAYISAVVTAGGSPTTSEESAIRRFYGTVDLTLWKRIFLPVWALAAPNAIDMVDPTRSGVWNGGVTHTAGESTGNGTTGYLSFGVSPSGAGLSSSNASLVFYQPVQDASSSFRDMGASLGGNYLQFIQYASSLYSYCMDSSAGLQSASGSGRNGLIMSNRLSTTREILQRITSGIVVRATATAAVSGTTPTSDMAGMGLWNGTAIASPSTRSYSLFGMGLGHTAAQRTTFLNAAYTMLNAFTTHKPTMV